jgi:butyrate kinase
MKSYNILAINPGSTSTKVAVYKDKELVKELTLRHTSDELKDFPDILSQFHFRKEIIMNAVKESGIDIREMDAIIGRGGLVKPIPSGVYEVNDALKRDLRDKDLGEHASNLGGLIADDIAQEIGVKAYIADPVVVDELQDVARVCGLPNLHRVSIFHALNQKAIAREYAERIGKKYEDLNLILAHLGGGVSVGAHLKGEVIDVNNALDGEGPMSPERAGTLPTRQLAELCFSGKYTYDEVRKMITGRGGFTAHLGTNNAMEVEERIAAGDSQAKLVFDAMCYEVAKNIGAMATVLHGKVDAIILTGGMAHSKYLCKYVEDMVSFIAPVVVMAGENELEALAMNALRVLNGTTIAKIYS